MSPRLVGIQIRDTAQAWSDAGFAITQSHTSHDPHSEPEGSEAANYGSVPFTQVGEIRLSFLGLDHLAEGSACETLRGIHSWTFTSSGKDDARPEVLDGIATNWSPLPHADMPNDDSTGHESEDQLEPSPRPANPNRIDHLDHVVMTTQDMDRSMSALVQAGFELRRVREIPPNQQAFFWAGETIIELVGPSPAEPNAIPFANLWGLAFTSQDLIATREHLGDNLSEPRSAVQAGRQIATLRGKNFGISVPTVIMSPHPRS